MYLLNKNEPNKNIKNNRIGYIDNAKAICIFLMVLGHADPNILCSTYIYSFHMPALFLISGMLFKPHNFIKTFYLFAIPILFYSLINLGWQTIITDSNINEVLKKWHLMGYRYGQGLSLFSGLWFIWALYGLRCTFGDIVFFKKLQNHLLILSLCAILLVLIDGTIINIDSLGHGFYIIRAIPALPFFCFGFFLKQQNFRPKQINICIIIASFICFCIIPIINGRADINSNYYGSSYLLFLINAIIVSLLLLFICEIIPSYKWLRVFSKGTLMILGLHSVIFEILNCLFNGCIIQRISSILYPIIAMLILYYPIIWCDKYIPILLGKNVSRIYTSDNLQTNTIKKLIQIKIKCVLATFKHKTR